ncbi:phosphatidylserine decarboxylase [Desulfocicer niacini]
MNLVSHQYIERGSTAAMTESLYQDAVVQTLYATVRENAPFLFNLLVSRRFSNFLGFLNYDFPLHSLGMTPTEVLNRLGISQKDIHGPVDALSSYRKIFERQIRYWDVRPMEIHSRGVVSPADARVLFGAFNKSSKLFIKEKFFSYAELIGKDKPEWFKAFHNGDYAIFRLTPDKYHYNHAPVSGRVVDIYEINGLFHSCNPGAVVQAVTPLSKNRRVVTIIDTDVKNGTGVGLVAMVEIVALMIGRIQQCYSDIRYDHPVPVEKGLFIRAGQPKSLFRPGSSTTVLIFQKNRCQFSEDLLKNRTRQDVSSRFTRYFNHPLVETEIHLRETIGGGI